MSEQGIDSGNGYRFETAEAHNAPLVGKGEVLSDVSVSLELAYDTFKEHHGMGMNDYQRFAKETAIYPLDMRIIYPALGLCGETGEVAEKIKKWIRDADRKPLTPEQLDLLKKELGDVLWYVAALATDLGLSLDDVAKHNIEKLSDRKKRGMVHGKGDVR